MNNMASSSPREISLGPYRVFPGRLSVSRSIGDYNAKWTEKGGNNKVLIAVPDIHKIKIGSNLNFLILGSDGLFDNQSNLNIIDHVSKLSRQKLPKDNFHEFVGRTSTSIIENAMNVYKSTDNISCIMVAFKDFTLNMKKLTSPCKFQDLTILRQDWEGCKNTS